jgi:hypothetical protein
MSASRPIVIVLGTGRRRTTCFHVYESCVFRAGQLALSAIGEMVLYVDVGSTLSGTLRHRKS